MEAQINDHSAYRTSRVYDELISQDEFDDDGQMYDNRQVSISTERASACSKRYRACSVSLAVLSAVLLLLNIGLGVHYSKARAGQLSPYRNISRIRAELEERRVSYQAAYLSREETLRQFQREVTQRGTSSWELDFQRRRNNIYEKQIDTFREEKAEMQLNLTKIEVSCKHCPAGWVFIDHLCYFFANNFISQTWDVSRKDCLERGADLAVVNSSEKQDGIYIVINRLHKSSRIDYWKGFWIGLRDVEAEDRWKWLDGTELTEGYWHEGEPNNDRGIEDCAAIYAGADRRENWNDAPCEHPLKWICEKPPLMSSS